MNLFVMAMTDVGQIWLAKLDQENFEDWQKTGTALRVKNPRALVPVPSQQENAQALAIGPLYYGDTPQDEVYVRNFSSIEVLGNIEHDLVSNVESCSDNNTLFMQYCSAIDQWKAARSPISMATGQDLQALGNTIPFPQK